MMSAARRALLLLTPIALAAALGGCRTTDAVMADYSAALASGRYEEAAAEPQALAEKGDGSRLLWRLMAARALDLAGDTQSALAAYDVAEDAMADNDQTSVFAQAADEAYAMMLNDKLFPYDGGGQDRIFTCLYKAVAYGSEGRIAPMRTELNRAAAHQENWLAERRKDLAAAQERLERESASYAAEKGGGGDVDVGQSSVVVGQAMGDRSFGATVKEAFGFDIFTSGILDKLRPADYQNPYMSHVCGVFRWMSGDGGRNHLKDAATLRPGNAVARADFAECDAGARPTDAVWVYVEDGLCPEREAWRIDLPLFLIPYAGKYVKYAGLCLPRLRPRAAAASAWSVAGVPMLELADVDALVKVEYDVYMRGALAREITRTVVDVGVQVALGVVAENVSDNRTRLALQVSQYGVAAYSAMRRGADTRGWTALPKKVYVARVARPADGVVSIVADGHPAVQVTVPQGCSMVFVRKPGAAAQCAVRLVALGGR